MVTLFNGIKICFQGNGNPSWSGLIIGLALGFAWSELFITGLSWLLRRARPPSNVAFWAAALISALVALTAISVRLWG